MLVDDRFDGGARRARQCLKSPGGLAVDAAGSGFGQVVKLAAG
jgi:hypothetical protein